MDPGCQQAARALLSSKEIRDLNGGALGVIPQDMLDTAFAHMRVPPGLEQVLEAETRIRSLMSGGSYDYSQIESLAVLPGAAESDSSREVPEERWLYHPDGYFVRYEVQGYPSTDIYLAVPDYYAEAYDNLGRIVSGNRQQGQRCGDYL